MKIFIMGLTSSSLGGMEYHNLGNYAIIEPLIIYLKKEFPNAEISTSIQMSEDFCKKFNILSFHDKRFWTYGIPTGIATLVDICRILIWLFFHKIFRYNFKYILETSLFLNVINNSDLIIDFSGDIYGDNANNRQFLENSAKIFFSLILRKPVAILIGSPGPFKNNWRKGIAKNLLNRVDLITNREPISTDLLKDIGVTSKKMKTTACPAFLFKPKKRDDVLEILKTEKILPKEKPLIGMIICGWNMPQSPFNKIPRDKEELIPFAELINYAINIIDTKILLMTHQNKTDNNGNLIRGNDHEIISQLYSILQSDYSCEKDIIMLNGLYDAATMKAIISCCDLLISGRIHGAVAGLSQCIPTVIIDYGHEPKAHKLHGFARLVGMESYICNPNDALDMINTVSSAWENIDEITEQLNKRIPEVQKLAKSNFKHLHELVDENNIEG